MIKVDKENINYILRRLWVEIIYLIITIIYLIFLNKFNYILLSKFDNNDYINILFYNNYETIIYFSIAIVLFVIGSMLIIYRWRKIQYERLEFEDTVLYFVVIFILLILLILIIIFINNPILRAVLAGAFIIYVACSSK